jgi:predicted DNA-binding transcriptional regulator YafY
MPRGDALRRQWSLVQMLQSHRYGRTLDEIAEEPRCNRRTVQRDINVLRQVGLPIEFATNEDGHGQRRYALPHGYLERGGLLLTITEALSLYLAKALMGPLAGTSIGEAFDRLIERIEHGLSDKTLRHFRNLQGLLLVLSPGRADYSRCRDIISAVDAAVRERRVLRITYHSQWRGDDYTTEIHPYGLVFWLADLYVVAYSCHAHDMRVFKVTRIRDAVLTSKTFNRPEEFDLEDYFSPSISVMRAGSVFESRVEFAGPAIGLVRERKWHPSLRVVVDHGDRLVVRLKVCDPVGLKQWVKSFGPHAKLLSPQHLREELRQELAATAALYESTSPAGNAPRGL